MNSEYDDLEKALAEIFGAAGAGAPAAHPSGQDADDDEPFGELIHSYSRAQALADAVLIEVPDDVRREAGFCHPMAMTAAAWADTVAWGPEDNRRKGTVEDESGRLWDVLTMAGHAARKTRGDTSRTSFHMMRTPREGRGRTARKVSLELHIGPGDTPEPVLTLMLPHED